MKLPVRNPMGWPTPPLGAVAATLVPQRDKPLDLSGPIPWVRIEDFDGPELSMSKTGQGVTDEIVAAMNLRVMPVGTVVCTCSCNMGATAIVTAPLVTNQTFIGLVPNAARLSSRYLFHSLAAYKPLLDAEATGAIQQYLSQDDFRQLRIPLPALSVQDAIADFLDVETRQIDDLIDRKRRLLELQQERRASLVATLLSNGGDASARWMGSVPIPWPLVSLGLMAEVFNGTTPEGIDRESGDVAWVTSGDIDQGLVSRPSGYVSESIRRANGMRVAPPGSVVVGLIGQGRTRGSSAQLGLAAVLNQNIAAIVPRDQRLNTEYIRLVLLLAYEDLRNGGRGANQAALNCEMLKRYQIPIAPVEAQAKLVQVVASAHAKEEAIAAALRRQIGLLQERRQALITAAVTGQIEIPGVAA